MSDYGLGVSSVEGKGDDVSLGVSLPVAGRRMSGSIHSRTRRPSLRSQATYDGDPRALYDYCCSEREYMEEIVTLIDRGIDLDWRDSNGRTALYWAASNGYGNAVVKLVQCGATMMPSPLPDHSRDKSTPVHAAAGCSMPVTEGCEWSRVIEVMIATDSRVMNLTNLRGDTALDLAVELKSQAGWPEIIEIMQKKGALSGDELQ